MSCLGDIQELDGVTHRLEEVTGDKESLHRRHSKLETKFQQMETTMSEQLKVQRNPVYT